MAANREEMLRRLERFNQTTCKVTTFSVFFKPLHPEPVLEAKLSDITSHEGDSGLDELVKEFNEMFTPCRVEYSSESTTDLTGESNTSGHSQLEAMGKLADELGISEKFDAACRAVDEKDDLEPMHVFNEELIKAFSDRWTRDHEVSYLAKIIELGFDIAMDAQDLDRMIVIISESQKPMFFDFFNRINELMANKMDLATIVSLVEQSTEVAKNSIKEVLERKLASNAIVASM